MLKTAGMKATAILFRATLSGGRHLKLDLASTAKQKVITKQHDKHKARWDKASKQHSSSFFEEGTCGLLSQVKHTELAVLPGTDSLNSLSYKLEMACIGSKSPKDTSSLALPEIISTSHRPSDCGATESHVHAGVLPEALYPKPGNWRHVQRCKARPNKSRCDTLIETQLCILGIQSTFCACLQAQQHIVSNGAMQRICCASPQKATCHLQQAVQLTASASACLWYAGIEFQVLLGSFSNKGFNNCHRICNNTQLFT